jgi:hypothetical protein
MSALGQSHHFGRVPVASGLPPVNGHCQNAPPRLEVPLAIFCAAENSTLFDHPVGDGTEVLVLSISKSRGIIKFRDQHYPRRSWIMDIDRDHIDEAILALLFLGRHDGMRTWKSFDWAAMERLHTKGLISDPVGKAKSVVFTDEGLRQSEALFRKLFAVGREA